MPVVEGRGGRRVEGGEGKRGWGGLITSKTNRERKRR